MATESVNPLSLTASDFRAPWPDHELVPAPWSAWELEQLRELHEEREMQASV